MIKRSFLLFLSLAALFSCHDPKPEKTGEKKKGSRLSQLDHVFEEFKIMDTFFVAGNCREGGDCAFKGRKMDSAQVSLLPEELLNRYGADIAYNAAISSHSTDRTSHSS